MGNKEVKPEEQKILGPNVGKDQLELELNIPKTLRTEFNFLKFPFFDLAKDSQRTKIKIEEWVDTKEGKFHILWLVTRDIEGQFPGDFEKRLHRAIEQVVNATPKPIANPLRLGSLRYIASVMGIYMDSGKNYQDIQRAFKNIVKASIEAEGTFQLKDSKTKQYIQDTFHLYDRVIFKGEKLPDGSIADSVYLMLGSWYLQNINNNYVVPLDWRFYNRLTGAITTRMYEYLSIYFYAALERAAQYHDVRYSQICSYFPLTRQYPLWKARKQLKHAHESLAQMGYFAKVEWFETNDAEDWVLRYWIGLRAREEYERNKKEIRQFGVTMTKAVPIPEQRRRIRPLEGTQRAGKAPNSVEELVARGLTAKVAKKLRESHSEAYIAHKIEVFDFLMEQESGMVTKNPAGFLRKSIEDDYADPVDFVSKEERERQAQKAAAQQKQQEWRKKMEDYKIWLEAKPEHKVFWDLRQWEKRYDEEQGRKPTKEEVNAQQAKLIASLPTDTEKQQEIFGKVVFREGTLEPLDKSTDPNLGSG
jgi:hypothetical protein